jgi:transposase
MLDYAPELDGFIRTFEAWQEEILNYFEAGQSSGPVEGINNKARVILKRAYGLRSADSLWTRLILLRPTFLKTQRDASIHDE